MELTAEEQTTLAVLDQSLNFFLSAKLKFLREAHGNRGEIATTLEGLKSKRGRPFVPMERFPGRRYTQAVVQVEAPFSLAVETAYLCKGIYQEEDPDSCGWVKGEPNERSYDDIGVLSGSAGHRYYCRICGKQIGEVYLIMSFRGA